VRHAACRVHGLNLRVVVNYRSDCVGRGSQVIEKGCDQPFQEDERSGNLYCPEFHAAPFATGEARESAEVSKRLFKQI